MELKEIIHNKLVEYGNKIDAIENRISADDRDEVYDLEILCVKYFQLLIAETMIELVTDDKKGGKI